MFLLIQGSCTLYVAAALESGIGEITAVELEPGRMYNVRKGVWHTHVTGPGAKIAIIEDCLLYTSSRPAFRRCFM